MAGASWQGGHIVRLLGWIPPLASWLMSSGSAVLMLATPLHRTAIHLAARSADANMLQVLLDGLDAAVKEKLVNQTDMFGITPVFLAMQK